MVFLFLFLIPEKGCLGRKLHRTKALNKNFNIFSAGPPDTPVINGSSQMTENVPTNLTCMADMGYPNDWMLDWFNEDTPIMPMSNTTADPSGSRYTFSSQIEFTPTRPGNRNTIIKCTAQRDSWTTQKGSFGPIDVQCK